MPERPSLEKPIAEYRGRLEVIDKRVAAVRERLRREASADVRTVLEDSVEIAEKITELENKAEEGAAEAELTLLQGEIKQAFEDFEVLFRDIETRPSSVEDVADAAGVKVHAPFVAERKAAVDAIDALIDEGIRDANGLGNTELQAVREEILKLAITAKDKKERAKEIHGGAGAPDPAEETQAATDVTDTRLHELEVLRDKFVVLQRKVENDRNRARAKKTREERERRAAEQAVRDEKGRVEKGGKVRAELQKTLLREDEAFRVELLEPEKMKEALKDVLPKIMDRALEATHLPTNATPADRDRFQQKVDRLAFEAAWDAIGMTGDAPANWNTIIQQVRATAPLRERELVFWKNTVQELFKQTQEQIREEAAQETKRQQAEEAEKSLTTDIVKKFSEKYRTAATIGVKALGNFGKYGAVGAVATFAIPGGVFAAGAIAGFRIFEAYRAHKKEQEQGKAAQGATVDRYSKNPEEKKKLQEAIVKQFAMRAQEDLRVDRSIVDAALVNPDDPRWKGDRRTVTIASLREEIHSGKYDDNATYKQELQTAYRDAVRGKADVHQRSTFGRLTGEGIAPDEARTIAEQARALYEMEQMNLLYEAQTVKQVGETKGSFVRGLDALGHKRVDEKVKTAAAMTALSLIGRALPGVRTALMAYSGMEMGAAFAERARAKEEGVGTYESRMRGLVEKMAKGVAEENDHNDARVLLAEVRTYLSSEGAKKRRGESAALRETLVALENLMVATTAADTLERMTNDAIAQTEQKGTAFAAAEKDFQKKKIKYRLVGGVLGAAAGGVLDAMHYNRDMGRHPENVVSAAGGAPVEQSAQQPEAPEVSHEPGHPFPKAAEHDRHDVQQMLEREPKGGAASVSAVEAGKERFGTTSEGVEILGGKAKVEMEYTQEAREFMAKYGIRFDARRAGFTMERDSEILKIGGDHDFDGKVDTEKVTIRLVEKDFDGDGRPEKYLQIEAADHAKNGVRELQRMYIVASGPRIGQYIGNHEGAVGHDAASLETSAFVAREGTMTEQVDVNGDGVKDEVTKLAGYEYTRGAGAGEKTYIVEAPAAAEVDGPEGTYEIELHAIDSDGDGDIDNVDIAAGQYTYATAGAPREDDGVMTLASEATRESGRDYGAVSAKLSYNEVDDALRARGDTTVLPHNDVLALRDAAKNLTDHPAHYEPSTHELTYWNATTNHLEKANISSLSLDPSVVISTDGSDVDIRVGNVMVFSDANPHFDSGGHLESLGSHSIAEVEQKVREVVLEQKVSTAFPAIDFRLDDGTFDKEGAQFALDHQAALSEDRINDILEHTSEHSDRLGFGDTDYEKMLAFQNQFATGTKFEFPATDTSVVIDQPGTAPDYQVINGKLHEIQFDSASHTIQSVGPEVSVSDFTNARAAMDRAHEVFLEESDMAEKAFTTAELLTQFKDAESMDAVLKSTTFGDYLTHKGDMGWQPFESPVASWSRDAFDKLIHKQLVDSGAFTEGKGGILEPTPAFTALHPDAQSMSLQDVLHTSFRMNHAHAETVLENISDSQALAKIAEGGEDSFLGIDAFARDLPLDGVKAIGELTAQEVRNCADGEAFAELVRTQAHWDSFGTLKDNLVSMFEPLKEKLAAIPDTTKILDHFKDQYRESLH